jgi:DNA-binding LacI/PurR family transcriptional regulator
MTIKDIAKESGYAVGTVSRVLNDQAGVSEKARARIMEVVDKYQFRLNSNAKLLKQQSTDSVAIIIKGNKNMLFAGLVETLQGRIKDKGYSSVVYYINEDGNEVEQAMQICRDIHPLGILFFQNGNDRGISFCPSCLGKLSALFRNFHKKIKYSFINNCCIFGFKIRSVFCYVFFCFHFSTLTVCLSQLSTHPPHTPLVSHTS